MATRDFVARATQRVLSRFGKDALLRGGPAGRAVVMTDLANPAGRLDDANDNAVTTIKIGIIGSEFDPRTGDLFEHPDGTFRLDRKVEDTGYVRHFILVAA